MRKLVKVKEGDTVIFDGGGAQQEVKFLEERGDIVVLQKGEGIPFEAPRTSIFARLP